MKGCRSITDSEIASICAYLNSRDSCLFILGIRTGFRISELLSLDVIDVTNTDVVKVRRSNMKGKTEGRAMPLHPSTRDRIRKLLESRPKGPGTQALFVGRRYNGLLTRLTPGNFHKSLKLACAKAGIDSKQVATHSMRKTFASKMWDAVEKDIYKLQELMGHKDISSTGRYIGINEKEVYDLVTRVK